MWQFDVRSHVTQDLGGKHLADSDRNAEIEMKRLKKAEFGNCVCSNAKTREFKLCKLETVELRYTVIWQVQK